MLKRGVCAGWVKLKAGTEMLRVEPPLPHRHPENSERVGRAVGELRSFVIRDGPKTHALAALIEAVDRLNPVSERVAYVAVCELVEVPKPRPLVCLVLRPRSAQISIKRCTKCAGNRSPWLLI